MQTIGAIRSLAMAAMAAAAMAAQAQLAAPDFLAPAHSARPVAGLGLNPAKIEYAIGCGSSLRPCRDPDAALATTLDTRSLRWGMEMGVVALGQASSTATGPTRQGLNISLVGRQPLFGSSFSVFGRVGTTYGMPDATGGAALAGNPVEAGYGLSYGAGLSMAVTPRLSATFSVDSHDLRLTSGLRDASRATSLGLQYRY